MEYKVAVTEILRREVKVDAENEDMALFKAKKLYYNCDIVLSAYDFIDVDFELVEERDV